MKSTKFLAVCIGLGLILLGYLLTGLMPLLASQFTIYCGAISGLVMLFVTGNIGAQFVAAKAQTDQHRDAVENGILPEPQPDGQSEASKEG